MSSVRRTGPPTGDADSAALRWPLLALAQATHARRLAAEAEGFERAAHKSRTLVAVRAASGSPRADRAVLVATVAP